MKRFSNFAEYYLWNCTAYPFDGGESVPPWLWLYFRVAPRWQ